MQGIKRQIIDEILADLQQMPAVVLLGAKQIGKTTLAQTIGEQADSVYLDLGSAADMQKLHNFPQFLANCGAKLIILDEIQRVPNLFLELRGHIDKNRKKGKRAGQFLLLGSAPKDLLRQSAESLAGRISFIEMSGLNVLETQAPLQRLWLRGGFPDSYLASSGKASMRWLEHFIKSYLERDIGQITRTIAPVQIRRLWTMLAHSQGEVANINKLATSLQMNNRTVRQYINIFCDLMLLRALPPFYTNIKKRLVKMPRYYVRDSGVLHRLLGINTFEALCAHPVVGKSWEGFVIENILSVLSPLAECFFYRTAAGGEIDLIIKTPAAEYWGVEIKYSNAPKISKHYPRIAAELGLSKQFVIYGGEDAFAGMGDTWITPLPLFLAELKKM